MKLHLIDTNIQLIKCWEMAFSACPKMSNVWSTIRVLPIPEFASTIEFQRIVNKYNGDYRTKNFKCWNQMGCKSRLL